MKKILIVAATCAGITGAATTNAQAGCLTGALVGGIAGHFAGHHGFAGAAAGCAIGHHRKVMQRRAQQQGQLPPQRPQYAR